MSANDADTAGAALSADDRANPLTSEISPCPPRPFPARPTASRPRAWSCAAGSRPTPPCSRLPSTPASTTCGRGCPGPAANPRTCSPKSSACANFAASSIWARISSTASSPPTKKPSSAAPACTRARGPTAARSAIGSTRTTSARDWPPKPAPPSAASPSPSRANSASRSAATRPTTPAPPCPASSASPTKAPCATTSRKVPVKVATAWSGAFWPPSSTTARPPPSR